MNKEYLSVASEIHELEEIISSIPPEDIIEKMSFEARLKNVKEKLTTLSETKKMPAVFRRADYDQIKTPTARLKDNNIHETDESYRGEFQGILPAERTFEFKLVGKEAVIRGEIDSSIGEPDILNKNWLHKPVTVKFRVIILDKKKPRYTLLSLNDLKDNEN